MHRSGLRPSTMGIPDHNMGLRIRSWCLMGVGTSSSRRRCGRGRRRSRGGAQRRNGCRSRRRSVRGSRRRRMRLGLRGKDLEALALVGRLRFLSKRRIINRRRRITILSRLLPRQPTIPSRSHINRRLLPRRTTILSSSSDRPLLRRVIIPSRSNNRGSLRRLSTIPSLNNRRPAIPSSNRRLLLSTTPSNSSNNNKSTLRRLSTTLPLGPRPQPMRNPAQCRGLTHRGSCPWKTQLTKGTRPIRNLCRTSSMILGGWESRSRL